MPEREIPRPHPHGPIQKAEVPAIVASMERFLAQEPSQLTGQREQGFQTFPEVPPHLIRRFHLRQPGPQDGESWIPWEAFPDGLFQRVEMADECKRKIYQAHRYDEKTGESNLTPKIVRRIFARERPHLLRAYGPFAGDFDLHDVYVCAEATLLQFYARREQYPNLSATDWQVNQQLLNRFEMALTAIGQTLSST